MNDVTGNQVMEQIAELQALLDKLQPEPQSNPRDQRTLMMSDAQDIAKQLGEYLRKLQDETMDKLAKIQQDGITNNTWMVQIDRHVKDLSFTLQVLAVIIVVAAAVIWSAARGG